MEGTTNSDIRLNNRKRLVSLLFRHGPMTKQEIAASLHISLPTVSTILKELAEQMLVTESGSMNSTGGRKATSYAPILDAKYSLGADASEQGLRIVLLDLGGNIVATAFHPIQRDNTLAYWSKVSEIIEDFGLQHTEQGKKLLEVGITLEESMKDGQLALRDNQVAHLDLRTAADCFQRKVTFRNSTKMAAMAQIWALENWNSNFVFLKLGNHVRGALVYQGDVVDFSNINGEFGDMLLMNGSQDRLAQRFSLQRFCESLGVPEISAAFERIEQEKEQAVAVWNTYLDDVAALLYNLHCIFGWQIIVGGMLSPYIEQHKNDLVQKIQAHSVLEMEDEFPLTISNLGEFGAAVGAALLPIDAFLSSSSEL